MTRRTPVLITDAQGLRRSTELAPDEALLVFRGRTLRVPQSGLLTMWAAASVLIDHLADHPEIDLPTPARAASLYASLTEFLRLTWPSFDDVWLAAARERLRVD